MTRPVPLAEFAGALALERLHAPRFTVLAVFTRSLYLESVRDFPAATSLFPWEAPLICCGRHDLERGPLNVLFRGWPAPEHLPCPGAVLERRDECLIWPGGIFSLADVRLTPPVPDRSRQLVCPGRVAAALAALECVIAPANNRHCFCSANAPLLRNRGQTAAGRVSVHAENNGPEKDNAVQSCCGTVPSAARTADRTCRSAGEDSWAEPLASLPRSPLPVEGLAPLLHEVLAATPSTFVRGVDAVDPGSAHPASSAPADPAPAHLPPASPDTPLASFLVPSNLALSPLDILLREQGREALRQVYDWLAADSLPPPRAAVTMLVGLGPGLTPSGDDVLGGVLLALHASGRRAEAQALSEAVGEVADATNRISCAHLAAAARGQGAATLRELIAALLDGETCLSRLASLVRGIGCIGHSSGWDAVLGACVALQAGCFGKAASPFGAPSVPR